MTTLDTPRRSALTGLRPLPLVAGSSALALAIYQVATAGPPTATYDSLLDWVRELLFLGYVVLSVAAARSAVRAGLAPRPAALLIGTGYGAIALGVSIGMALRDDPEWFMLLGGPGNLLAAAGFVVWAGGGVRRGVIPRFAALLCGVGGLVAVILAEYGTSVLIAAFWFYVASAGARSHQTRSYPSRGSRRVSTHTSRSKSG